MLMRMNASLQYINYRQTAKMFLVSFRLAIVPAQTIEARC